MVPYNIAKPGGDIDLYIETKLRVEEVHSKRIDLLYALLKRIGDQKIDIVVNILSDNLDLPIYTIAKNEGVQLV